MKTLIVLISFISTLSSFTSKADDVMTPAFGNENLQFVYHTRADMTCPCTLTAVTLVTQGADAQKLFETLSASYPKLVTMNGRMWLQPEIDLGNISCGLQVISHGPGPVTPIYQCYTSIDLPAEK